MCLYLQTYMYVQIYAYTQSLLVGLVFFFVTTATFIWKDHPSSDGFLKVMVVVGGGWCAYVARVCMLVCVRVCSRAVWCVHAPILFSNAGV